MNVTSLYTCDVDQTSNCMQFLYFVWRSPYFIRAVIPKMLQLGPDNHGTRVTFRDPGNVTRFRVCRVISRTPLVPGRLGIFDGVPLDVGN